MSAILLQQWQFTSTCYEKTPVLPDGCRDLIVTTDSRGSPTWFITDLAEATQWVPCIAGQSFMGFRLHPAVRIEERGLLAAFEQFDGLESSTQLIKCLEEFVQIDTNLAEVLEVLANTRRLVDVARAVCVSERTVERLIKKATGRNPIFWKNLARARRSARQLNSQQPLVELAADSGYADQAHMTREFRKWFGATPGQLLQNPELAAAVRVSGYG